MRPIQLPEWAQIKKRRKAHVERVATLCAFWAEAMGVSEHEGERWHRAAVLHDALKDAPHDMLMQTCADSWGIPALLHGPAAAARAEQDGETDRGVLDAVRYHSVGYPDWDAVGRVLFVADYLEPGRSYHTPRHGELLERVPRDFEFVLRLVAAERIAGAVHSGRPILPETAGFWNGLTRAS